MTAGGVKQLRLCPFCGSMGEPILKRSGAACFVYCNTCKSEGPLEKVYDYVTVNRDELSDDDNINAVWEAAEKRAMEIAAHRWNLRAWEGNFWPEDLERMDEKMEQETEDAIRT